jgi:hypothetical protein
MPTNPKNTYYAPKAPFLRPILICALVMALSSRREVLDTISPYLSPTATKAALWTQNGLFYFLFGAHAIETAIFTKRLNDNGISVASAAWWKWMGTCFVGGKFCFDWFDGCVGKAE